jgi:hypothetical protein
MEDDVAVLIRHLELGAYRYRHFDAKGPRGSRSRPRAPSGCGGIHVGGVDGPQKQRLLRVIVDCLALHGVDARVVEAGSGDDGVVTPPALIVAHRGAAPDETAEGIELLDCTERPPDRSMAKAGSSMPVVLIGFRPTDEVHRELASGLSAIGREVLRVHEGDFDDARDGMQVHRDVDSIAHRLASMVRHGTRRAARG